MTRRAGVLLALLLLAVACTDRRPEGDAIVVAMLLIAGDVPYISLWYKTNVAVFQPDLQGVRLSPIADFLFLKDVHRSGAPLTAGGAE
jgi:hypothetical protein